MDGLNECNFDTHKKVGFEPLYNLALTGSQLVWRPDLLETRCCIGSQHPAEWALRPPIEQLQLGIRWVRDKMLEWEHVPERLGPQAHSWATLEDGKETWLWPIEWGSICCSSIRSSTPSHTQPFQIKWEVYFSKDCVARLLYCIVIMIRHTSANVHASLLLCWVYNNVYQAQSVQQNALCIAVTDSFLINIFTMKVQWLPIWLYG